MKLYSATLKLAALIFMLVTSLAASTMAEPSGSDDEKLRQLELFCSRNIASITAKIESKECSLREKAKDITSIYTNFCGQLAMLPEGSLFANGSFVRNFIYKCTETFGFILTCQCKQPVSEEFFGLVDSSIYTAKSIFDQLERADQLPLSTIKEILISLSRIAQSAVASTDSLKG